MVLALALVLELVLIMALALAPVVVARVLAQELVVLLWGCLVVLVALVGLVAQPQFFQEDLEDLQQHFPTFPPLSLLFLSPCLPLSDGDVLQQEQALFLRLLYEQSGVDVEPMLSDAAVGYYQLIREVGCCCLKSGADEEQGAMHVDASEKVRASSPELT